MATSAGRETLPPRFLFRQALGAAVVALLWLAGAAAPCRAAVIEGLASYRGAVQPGVSVYLLAGPDLAPALGSPPAAVTDGQGRFRLEAKAGTWYLAAHRKARGARPALEPGDYYSFYNGNPVAVSAAAPAKVAFSLLRIPVDGEPVAGLTGVEGELRFDDKPLGRAYLYVYGDHADGFRGMGFSTVPVGPDGRFRVKLPPGRYWLIARQRMEGGMLGPLKKNDRAGYYWGNPVTVAEGKGRRVVLELTARVEQEEEMAPGSGGWRIAGVVRDTRGKPLAGMRVLAYDTSDASGRPRLVSGITGADGSWFIELPGPATVYLVARQNLGGPVEEGELTGRHQDAANRLRPTTVAGTVRAARVDIVASAPAGR